MSEQYEVYCLADRLFYDAMRQSPTRNPDFPIAAREAPDGWEHKPSDTWMNYAPLKRALPSQGWKIHVSACLDDAERALDLLWDYCVPRGIAFKFLRSRSVMVMLNSKSAFRGSSGKLATIYPVDETQLTSTLADLQEIVKDVKGPYILSDLRYGDGPLFVRYGGFAERHCIAENGERVLALEDGDGKLVPDVRGATFALPPWVSLPEFLEPHLAARAAVTTTGLPYQIESALQFSNGGGVYYGRDLRTDEQVVLKEGRPYAGLDVAGRDAVTRVSHERDILQRLAGLDVVPAVHDYFTLGDHHFLVQEFVDGNPLRRLLVQRYPLSHPNCTEQDLADYVEWALGMLERVDAAVAALHERGVVFGDLHLENILVTHDDKRLVLIDFEVATLAEDNARSHLAHPAFHSPSDRRGVDVDKYALACLHLGLFSPQLTTMVAMNRAKVGHLAELITETFPVPPARIEAAVRTIMGTDGGDDVDPMRSLPMPGVGTWESVRTAMSRAILASATPERDDRLFPGDVAQFRPGGGINVAHGTSGVLYALAATGAGRFPEHEDWLRKHALNHQDGIGPGFYDGLHGVAYVLDELGHRQDALEILDICLRARLDSTELGLYSGLAGIGLNLLHFGARTGDSTFTDAAAKVVDMVAERLGGPDDVPEISGGDNPRAGLMFGSSGPALLFLRAFEQTGDKGLLDKAATALRQDLRRCIVAEDGTRQVNQDWRILPYLDEGSVGIAMVLAGYLAHDEDGDFAAALRQLRAVTRSGYFVQSGLFAGRAGMIACAGMADADPDDTTELIRGLRWHALPYGDGLAFPGDQLLRLSMDLATGTAGVLLALGTALHDNAVFLPFLGPASPMNVDAVRHPSDVTTGGRR
ncbi:MAG TPA: class III lanthionine synthetase LanKC [Pseudonocardiaceae bacterium]|nr:class III lanthionine synthetase LanKC [Pseudonocardiaceae bacterium]